MSGPISPQKKNGNLRREPGVCLSKAQGKKEAAGEKCALKAEEKTGRRPYQTQEKISCFSGNRGATNAGQETRIVTSARRVDGRNDRGEYKRGFCGKALIGSNV